MLGNKAVREEGLDTNAHCCCVQVVQKKKSNSTPTKQEKPKNCATAQKLPAPKEKRNVVCDQTLMKHL